MYKRKKNSNNILISNTSNIFKNEMTGHHYFSYKNKTVIHFVQNTL